MNRWKLKRRGKTRAPHCYRKRRNRISRLLNSNRWKIFRFRRTRWGFDGNKKPKDSLVNFVSPANSTLSSGSLFSAGIFSQLKKLSRPLLKNDHSRLLFTFSFVFAFSFSLLTYEWSFSGTKRNFSRRTSCTIAEWFIIEISQIWIGERDLFRECIGAYLPCDGSDAESPEYFIPRVQRGGLI